MSNETNPLPPPLDLSQWRKLPVVLMVVGGLLSLVGLAMDPQEFGYAWLLAFMFFLTIALGSLFFVLVHHLTSAGWSVPIRRFCEHIASLLFPALAILFIPIALLAPKIFTWLQLPATDELIRARWPVFTYAGFMGGSALLFGVWWLLTARLRYWSLRQDVTGEALCTCKMRFYSGWGILAFAATLTGAAVLWLKSLEYQWFSAMYGVYFFAISAWASLAVIYILTVVLQRQRAIDVVMRANQFYYIGVLFFAFTVFSAYIPFAQYFVVWNANIPEETFWYLIRENGSWFALSMVLIFGHFFLPFFVMLPVKVKSCFKVMLPVCAWALAMNYADLAFNILPALHHAGYPFKWLWLHLGCLAFMGGFLSWVFIKKFQSHPPYPQRDPHVLEAMGIKYDAPDEIAGTSTLGGR
jgi:hypothetical protein